MTKISRPVHEFAVALSALFCLSFTAAACYVTETKVACSYVAGYPFTTTCQVGADQWDCPGDWQLTPVSKCKAATKDEFGRTVCTNGAQVNCNYKKGKCGSQTGECGLDQNWTTQPVDSSHANTTSPDCIGQ